MSRPHEPVMPRLAFLLLAARAIAAQEPVALTPEGTFTVIGGAVMDVSFDRTGSRMLTCGWFGDVVLTDTVRGEVMQRVHRPDGDVLCPCLHPDRPLAVVLWNAPQPASLALLDLRTGRAVWEQPCANVVEVAWTDEGDHFAARTQTGLAWFQLADGPALLPIVPVPTEEVERRCAGRWLRYRTLAKDPRWADLPGAAKWPRGASLVWRADTPRRDLAVLADSDGNMHLVRAAGSKVIAPHAGPVLGIAWSPDGRFLAASSIGGVTFATAAGAVVRRVQGAMHLATAAHGSEVWMVGRDGASAVDSATGATVRAWPLPAGKRVSELGPYPWIAHRTSCSLPVVVAVGDALVLPLNGVLALWSKDGITSFGTSGGDPLAASWLSTEERVHARGPDGAFVVLESEVHSPCHGGFPGAAEPGAVQVITRDGKRRTTRLPTNPQAAVFSHDGTHLVVATQWDTTCDVRAGEWVFGSRPARLLRVDVASGEVSLDLQVDRAIEWLAFANLDAARLLPAGAGAGASRTARTTALLALQQGDGDCAHLVVRDPRTLAVRGILDLGKRPVTAASLSPDGTALALGRGCSVEIYRL